MLNSTLNLSTNDAVVHAGRVVGLMSTWLKDRLQPPQVVLGIIEGYMHRVACPVYLGAISLFVGWSLAQVEEMLNTMQDAGLVRPLTHEEKKQHAFREGDNVWCLVEKPTPAKARW
jgi:hypothetical protein